MTCFIPLLQGGSRANQKPGQCQPPISLRGTESKTAICRVRRLAIAPPFLKDYWALDPNLGRHTGVSSRIPEFFQYVIITYFNFKSFSMSLKHFSILITDLIITHCFLFRSATMGPQIVIVFFPL
jgi:hypothetical protein